MIVWFPYEFALLSNNINDEYFQFTVWFPYEFALLSNPCIIVICGNYVWFPYEFALLSNSVDITIDSCQFDSPTNLHCSQTYLNANCKTLSLIPLRICTALKQDLCHNRCNISLIPLRICTALKRGSANVPKIFVWFPYEFALLSNPLMKKQIVTRVWFPYEFALLSNTADENTTNKLVWFPYEFALLSNLALV